MAQRHRAKVMQSWGQRLESCIPKSRNAKGCLQPAHNGEEVGKVLFLRALRNTNDILILDTWPLEPERSGREKSKCLSSVHKSILYKTADNLEKREAAFLKSGKTKH